MTTFYPLSTGNVWTYRQKDGSTFTNTVVQGDGESFTMQNTSQPQPQNVRKNGDTFLTDSYEAGNWQVLMKDSLQKGDAWDIAYQANGIETVLKMSVADTGLDKEVAGKTYPNVALLEGDMKMMMNGQPVPMTYRVQYYYARGVGLILTTDSYGAEMALVSHELKG